MTYHRIIIGLWLAWLVYWIVRARGNKRTVYRAGLGWGGLYLAVIVAVAIVLTGLALRVDLRQLMWPLVPAVQWLGVALCAGGLLFSVWARRILGTNWSARPTLKEGHELITAGPYHYVRHPIYTGILLAAFGTALALGHISHGLIFLYLFVGLWLKSRTEEKLMLQQFPDAYPEYRRRTKAIIPWIF